jgi:hypothetical protein
VEHEDDLGGVVRPPVEGEKSHEATLRGAHSTFHEQE